MVSVYRCFDGKGNLLYVGVSRQALARMSNHLYQHYWTSAVATVTIEHFPNLSRALSAERRAILDERPFFNLPIRRMLFKTRVGKLRASKRIVKRNGG